MKVSLFRSKAENMKRYFTFKDDNSDKFWAVQVQNNKMTVVFGKTGTAGSAQTKEFETQEAAEKEANKLIKEKSRKGYVEKVEDNIGKIKESEFWGLIKRAKDKAEDTYEQVEILTEILAQRSEEDIIEFEKIFHRLYVASYTSPLWAAAYIINGGCSDDGFDYFRGWLIAQGKDVYYKSIDHPDYLAKIISDEDMGEAECEDMLYVAGKAYESKTGKDYEQFLDLFSPEPYPDINLDWNETGDDLKNRFPQLWKKFGTN